MDNIARVLLCNVLDFELPEQSDSYCNELFQYSKRFPRVQIKIEHDFKKIRQQYIDICRVIVNRTPKNMLVVTLFAANEQLMSAYNKVDSNIARMHAIWFSDVLNHIEMDSKFELNLGNVAIYLILSSIFILYMFK